MSRNLTAVISIIAIHGLNGGWRKSWTDPVTATFWLQDLLPVTVPETRVLSFDYCASKTSTAFIGDIARSLLDELAQLRTATNVGL